MLKYINRIDASALSLYNPDADIGYKFFSKNTPYFVLFGERDKANGGPFCSVLASTSHQEVINIIKQDFTAFNLLDRRKIGPNEITLFEGVVPTLPDVIIGIQTAYEISSISIYKK
jgi:hypothetical protein